ncbi:MAG: DUF3298 domain-containing protein [Thiohalocapsa sp.]
MARQPTHHKPLTSLPAHAPAAGMAALLLGLGLMTAGESVRSDTATADSDAAVTASESGVDSAAGSASESRPTLSREVIEDGSAVRLFHARGDLVEVEVVYPVLPDDGSGDDAAVTLANAAIAAAFGEAAEDFLTQYDEVLSDNGGEHIGNPWSFSLGYQGVYVTDTLVAVDGGGYMYTGGAHGGALYLPLVLERRSGARLKPADLFRPDSDWLELLARHSRSALADQEPFRSEPNLLTDEWFQEGTAPVKDNYGLLLPTAEGLRVAFSHYQIGPYAIGDFHVTVPYAALRDVLSPALFPTKTSSD